MSNNNRETEQATHVTRKIRPKPGPAPILLRVSMCEEDNLLNGATLNVVAEDGGETGGEVKLGQSRTDRMGALGAFPDGEIGTSCVGPEADGMAVKLPQDPFRAHDLGQAAGGRVEMDTCVSGDLVLIVGDRCQQGRDPHRLISVVLALPQKDPWVIAQHRAEPCDAAPLQIGCNQIAKYHLAIGEECARPRDAFAGG